MSEFTQLETNSQTHLKILEGILQRVCCDDQRKYLYLSLANLAIQLRPPCQRTWILSRVSRRKTLFRGTGKTRNNKAILILNLFMSSAMYVLRKVTTDQYKCA